VSTPEDKTDADAIEEETTEVADSKAEAAKTTVSPKDKRGINWASVLAFGILPVLALLLGAGAGFLRWEDSSRRDADKARVESVQAARDSTVALLSYKPETVDKDLGSARDRLTGAFLDAYTQLVNTVVIPGAKEKKISAVAQVPAAASVSAKPDHAVVLVFVDQTVVVGADAPTNTASSVRITMDKVGDRWLISAFEPI
jgi:Mce-associated membrane protein